MPGEEDLLEEFIAKELSHTPEQEVIAHFVRHVFAKMKLAGEARLVAQDRERHQ